MELDDLKQAWQTLGRQLERHDALNLQLLRDSKLDKARGSLRPLFWGQIAQILFGLLLLSIGVGCWIQHRDVPHLLAAGLSVHVFGVLTIAMAGVTLGMIARLDHAAPVVTIQMRLARLRRFYLINGMSTGLPWWVMWMPVVMSLAGLGGGDLLARAPQMVTWGLAVGVVGLLGTWWFHRWVHQPRRADLGRRLDEGAAGSSILKAQRLIDELAKFERE